MNGLKTQCLFVLLFFAAQTLGANAQGIQIDNSSAFSSFSALDNLPADLGTVKNLSAPSGETSRPFVVHIQDAHANPEAQANIFQMINYLTSKFPSSAVAIEGAEGPVHPEYFDFFPDESTAGDAVVRDLHEKGELSGAERFAWEQYKKQKSRAAEKSGEKVIRTIPVFGVEKASLYWENYQMYMQLLNARPQIETLMGDLRSVLATRQSHILNAQLRDFLKERDRRKSGKFDMTRSEGQSNLIAYFDYLQKQAKKVVEIDLERPVEQIRFPNFVRVLYLRDIEQSVNPSKAAEDWNQVLSLVRSEAKTRQETALYQSLDFFARKSGMLHPETGGQLKFKDGGDPYPRILLEKLYEFTKKKNLDLSPFPAFLLSWKAVILQAEIEFDDLFLEMERLEQPILEKLAVTDEEKRLVRQIETLNLIEKLLYSELTRDEYEKLMQRKPEIDEVLAQDSKAHTQILPYYRAGLRFYEIAHTRELELMQSTLAQAEKLPSGAGPKVVILVTGGFHTEGLQNLFRERQVGYAVLVPRLSQTAGGLYEKVMSGAHADLSAYFGVPNPFATKQQALLFKEDLEVAMPFMFEKEKGKDITEEVKRGIDSHPLLKNLIDAQILHEGDKPFLRFMPETDARDIHPDNAALSEPRISAGADFYPAGANAAANVTSVPEYRFGTVSPRRWATQGNFGSVSVTQGILRKTLNAKRPLTKPAASSALPISAKPAAVISRSELRSVSVSGPENILMKGVGSGVQEVAFGELKLWKPGEKKINISLRRPYEDDEDVAAKIQNEKALLALHVRGFMERMQEGLVAERYQVVLHQINAILLDTEQRIQDKEIKAEVALEEILKEQQASLGEHFAESVRLTTVLRMSQELLPSIKDREALLTSETESEFAKIELQRERTHLMVRLSEHLLRTPYGLTIMTEGLSGDELKRAENLIKNSKDQGTGLRSILSALIPEIVRLVEKEHYRGPRAIQKVIDSMLKPRIKSLKEQRIKNPNSYNLNHNLEIFEGQERLLEQIIQQYDTYEFTYETSDKPRLKLQKVQRELQRYETALRITREHYQKKLPEDFLPALDKFVRNEIQNRARTLDYAIAKAFGEQFDISKGDIPDSILDFFMRLNHYAKYGEPVPTPNVPIIVFATAIPNELAEQELYAAFQGQGRIVGIATLRDYSPRETAGRQPHWLINAKSQGIAAIESIAFTVPAHDLSVLEGNAVEVIMDSREGTAVVRPTPEMVDQMRARAENYKHLNAWYLKRAKLSAPVRYWADEYHIDRVSSTNENESYLSVHGAKGIGLMRMEQLMTEPDRPATIQSNEWQLSAAIGEFLAHPYFSAVNYPLVVRIFAVDANGEKRPRFFTEMFSSREAHDIVTSKSDIRFYLDTDPRFIAMRNFGKMQLRALLHAYLDSGQQGIRLLLPNVRTAEEIRQFKQLLNEAKGEVVYAIKESAKIQILVEKLNESGLNDAETARLASDAMEAASYEYFVQLLEEYAAGKGTGLNKELKKILDKVEPELVQYDGGAFEKKIRGQLNEFRVGYMFEELIAVDARNELMRAAAAQNPKTAPPFWGIGSNDLQQSVMSTFPDKDTLTSDLHPQLVRAVYQLAEAAKQNNTELTLEGEWGSSVRMLFVLMTLKNYYKLDVQPVASTDQIPQLLEMSRHIDNALLEKKFTVGKRQVSIVDLVANIIAGEIPRAEEFNAVLSQARAEIETAIAKNDEFKKMKARRQIEQQRSELREIPPPAAVVVPQVDSRSTRDFLSALRAQSRTAAVLVLPADLQAAVIAVAEDMGMLFSVRSLRGVTPDQAREWVIARIVERSESETGPQVSAAGNSVMKAMRDALGPFASLLETGNHTTRLIVPVSDLGSVDIHKNPGLLAAAILEGNEVVVLAAVQNITDALAAETRFEKEVQEELHLNIANHFRVVGFDSPDPNRERAQWIKRNPPAEKTSQGVLSDDAQFLERLGYTPDTVRISNKDIEVNAAEFLAATLLRQLLGKELQYQVQDLPSIARRYNIDVNSLVLHIGQMIQALQKFQASA